MKFMMIVKASKDSEAGLMPSEALLLAMTKYNEELAKAGVLLDAAGLRPTSTGARIKFSGGKRTIIDGPFTETKELIAGYWAANAPGSYVTMLNIDAPPGHDGPYKRLRKRFAETKSLFKLIEGRAAVRKEYHDVLVPAFCLQATRDFFGNF